MKRTKLIKHIPLLKILRNLKKEHKADLIQYLNKDSIDCISCLVRNALSNKSLSKKQRRNLKRTLLPHKKALRSIADSKKSISLRKKNLEQVGGSIIGGIISTLLPLVTSLFSQK